MGDEGRVPFAASVRNPGPEPDRVESFELADAEDPMRFPLSDADAGALEARRNASTPKPQATPEERDQLVRGCLDAVEAWRGVYGAGSLFVEGAAAELGLSVPEMEALLHEEAVRRKR